MGKEARATEDKAKEVGCNRATEDRCNTEGRCNKEVPATGDKAKEVVCNMEVMKIKAVNVKNIEITNRTKIRFNF